MFCDELIPILKKVPVSYVAYPSLFTFAANCLQLQWRSLLPLLISYSATFNSMPEMFGQWSSWSRYIEHVISLGMIWDIHFFSSYSGVCSKTNCSVFIICYLLHLNTVPGVIGCLQALEAIKVAGAVGEPLSGRMLLFDALSARIRVVCISNLNYSVSQL